MQFRFSVCVFFLLFTANCTNTGKEADLIFHRGKIVTVDKDFSIAEAVAIKDGLILAIGKNSHILKHKAGSTKIIDLKGRTIIPGIIENHAHPISASQSELQHMIPDLGSIDELLSWIYQETQTREEGDWIIHPKFFSTRMKELRQPTLAELDSVAPDNPIFLNGSYGGMINTMALEKSDIVSLNNPGILRNPVTGKPTGFIRSAVFNLLSINNKIPLAQEQKEKALTEMFARYNAVGITSVCAGLGSPDDLDIFESLRNREELTVRIYQNMYVPFDSHTSINEMRESLQQFQYKTGDGDEWIKIGALKIVLDGGILTGTAYMREPWGTDANKVFGVTDPGYRGELNLTREELIDIITSATEAGWKFTAHVTGGGGVDVLLSALEEVDNNMSITEKRHSIIHGNFYSPDAIQKMETLGIYADMQPAWYYKDTDFLHKVLGMDRLASFHPYRSLFDAGVIVNGGSDHMVKLDRNTSINPYNPFLSMWSVITRKNERGSVFYPEEALSRRQALQMYTINNAYATFEEDIKGSIETGKLADMVVLSDDILSCPVDVIKDIKAELTIVNGKIVYVRE